MNRTGSSPEILKKSFITLNYLKRGYLKEVIWWLPTKACQLPEHGYNRWVVLERESSNVPKVLTFENTT
jgi:hypothetical protein